jgi:hypothetical protein
MANPWTIASRFVSLKSNEAGADAASLRFGKLL